ncbi:hypothetical protein PMNALOAF_3541 [Methylobacterium adhaesivum]|uniref:PIN domain-containing protein n=1 Tax=Methylobacterium adhaesivum TaxID=333297 RepID=A0ABT8BJQ9_9HYPH|nr:hypothetical protein [Methylobacterium adhaesivum]MDN3592399.1 hypothetical protein [Methylobacterium adhaesivum]GJD32273.1 hypothetical protein PMNALOAF_3541 [Methylobacterium adhaesivum]
MNTKPLLDTNYLYAALDPGDAEADDLRRLLATGRCLVSSVSVVEWIVRHGHPERGHMDRLAAGIDLLHRHAIPIVQCRFLSVEQSELDAVCNATSLEELAPLHRVLLERRIEAESQFLNWTMNVALGAYFSDIAHSQEPATEDFDARVGRLAEAILGSNQDLIADTVRKAVRRGYDTGNQQRVVGEALNDLRAAFVTAARQFLGEISGTPLAEGQVEATLDIDKLRRFITRSAKDGNYDRFLRLVGADMQAPPGSKRDYVIRYLLQVIRSPVERGGNYKKNDVNDSFLVGHMEDAGITIITRDGGMRTALAELGFRHPLSVAEALAKVDTEA